MLQQKLYSPKQIGVACFFGTAVASIAMMAINYKIVGEGIKSRLTFMIALLFLPATVFVLINLVEKNGFRVMAFIFSFAMIYFAEKYHGPQINKYIVPGLSARGIWSVIGVIAISDTVILLSTFLYLIFKDLIC